MKLLSTLHSAFVASSAVRSSSPSQSTFNLATRRAGAEALRMSTSGSEYSPDDLGKKYPELLVFDMVSVIAYMYVVWKRVFALCFLSLFVCVWVPTCTVLQDICS